MVLALTTIAALSFSVPPDSLEYRGRAGQLDVPTPRLEDVEIRVDGRLDEPAWGSAAVLSEFTHYEPVEGVPAVEPTEVRVFYTADAIYFGVRAHDSRPDMIQARLSERDRAAFTDDWVRIMLDTFDDQRQAYVFYVTPFGLQTDGLWIEGLRTQAPVSIDFSPDFIWESEGRIDDGGWTAEIRIPYISIRFREIPVQDWGLQVARETRRNGFKQSWAPLTKDISSTLAQSGHLRGLRDLRPRRLVEVSPIATGRRVGTVTDGAFGRDSFEPDFGANARLGLTQNLVLDATVNPDFSQVEADADRITVNERFALFFPEKRPFFLEGAEVFRTPAQLVYTRQIADPIAGAKVTGKVGSFSVGYLGAVDEGPVTLGGGDERAIFNLVRARRDIGRGSTFGLLYTDRTLEGGDAFNRVLGADARLLFRNRYTVTTQLAGSWTATGEDGEDVPLRPLVMAAVERSGRTFTATARFEDIHPDFRSRSGFINRTGDTEAFASASVTHYGRPGSLVESARVEIRTDNFFDHDAFWKGSRPYESEVELQPSLVFRGGRTLTVIFRDGWFRFTPEDYEGYGVEAPGGEIAPFVLPEPLEHMLALGVIPRFRVNQSVQLNGRLYLREVPLFQEAARGLELQVAPDLTLRPTDGLTLQLEHTYSRIRRSEDETVFSVTNLSRLRLQYQFSKALFTRVIAQYNLQDRASLVDPLSGRPLTIDGVSVGGSRTGNFQGQFLVSYEPSPGTIFYAGYSRLMAGAYGYRLSEMDLTDDGLFLKLSYLFRL